MNTMSGKGYLRIWVTEAGGSLPVPGVPVQIREEGGGILHVLRTGESGLTPTVELPAPPAAGSLTPNGSTRPYANYTVHIEMQGFRPVRELTVPVFDGITSLQPVSLLPQSGGETSGTPPYLVYPQPQYPRIRQGTVTPEDPLMPEEGRRPIVNTPDGEEIGDFTEDNETYLDDMDLPDYGRDKS